MIKHNELLAWNSIDNLNSFQISEYKRKLNRLEEKYPILKKLNKIPHLKLDLLDFDYKRAHKEILKATNDIFIPSNLHNFFETQKFGVLNHTHWSNRTLVNYSYDSNNFVGQRDKEHASMVFPELQPVAKKLLEQNKDLSHNDMFYYKTDLYDQMPYITNYIEKNVCDNRYRIILSKIKSKGVIEWHNHTNVNWNKDIKVNESLFLHIPVVSHSLVEMLVKIEDQVYSEYYIPGNLYIFNNIYDHAVINNSDIDRLHIVIMLPWSDLKLLNTIERTIKNL
jgi:hypothetical protein